MNNMAKFNLTSIELCGKKLEWKDCSHQTIVDYQKSLEGLLDVFQPALKEIEDLQNKNFEYNDEIADINEIIATIRSKENVSDKDQENILEYINERKELRKSKRENERRIKEIDDENKQAQKDIQDRIPVEKAKLVSKMVDITPEEYLEKATEYDDFLAEHLSEIRVQLLAGAKSAEIEKNLKKVVDSIYKKPFQ